MDARLQRIKELIEQKERVDAELENLLGGAPLKAGRARVCSVCNAEGHTARSCPTKSTEAA
jgi:zinc knuckle protein